MNKNLLAIAITAALALPTMAAAEVKIIGQAHLELVNTSDGPNGDGITLDDSSEAGKVGSGNASAMGVTGSHDLGNGMTGLYKINYNFHADDADDGLSARDRFVGLKGDFGTVLFGRLNSPYKTATVKYDPFLATFMQARGSNGMSAVGHNGYADEVIAYANKFGSVKFVGAVSLDEPTAADDNGDHLITFSLNMPISDSLELAFGYLDKASVDDGTAIKFGLKYKSGDTTIAGHYETLDAGLGDQSNIYVTATMALGSGASVSASFGSQTDESAGTNDGTYTAIGYKKALSKKVSYHAGVVIMDEGQVGAGNDVTQLGGGIRVKF